MVVMNGVGACVVDDVDYTRAVDFSSAVVVAPENAGAAPTVLIEEVAKRTGLAWSIVNQAPASGPLIVLSTGATDTGEEGFRLHAGFTDEAHPVIEISAKGRRGVLFGVGYLLRKMQWDAGKTLFPVMHDFTSIPDLPIRGHQLGYRPTANSYDAWDVAKYDQYIRELALFGTNAIENIPFQENTNSLMLLTREEMNLAMSGICARYDVDYWVWTPAVFDLHDEAKRAEEVARHAAFYRDTPRLDGVFFPGGDPGDNGPDVVVPFLEDIAKLLHDTHPNAGVWLSLQGFDKDKVDWFFNWLNEKRPTWLKGLVAGPSSPPIPELRRRAPAEYKLRDYPDITHSLLCQFVVPWWDPAFAFTLGRECINPRPQFYDTIIRGTARWTDGFSTYSDGAHDDVNKIVWSMLGWSLDADVQKIILDYTRYFFHPRVAERAADGILALEKNWEGPVALNGGITATLLLWTQLEQEVPALQDNWRWVMCLLRAAYDAHSRQRLSYETALEHEANAIMLQADVLGADKAMAQATAVLERAVSNPAAPDLKARIEDYGEKLFKLIDLQTSVEKYHAHGFERGAYLDFLDRPLNNRWWLEDEFVKIRSYGTEQEKVARLGLLGSWDDPGPGGFYDSVGNIAKSEHVFRSEPDPTNENVPHPDFGTWSDQGRSRLRLSWLCYMDWPERMVYNALDPDGDYLVRIVGKKDVFLHINGQRIKPSSYSTVTGEFKEFPVPKYLLKEGKITLTFDKPDESQLNWRCHSNLAEVWLIKQKH